VRIFGPVLHPLGHVHDFAELLKAAFQDLCLVQDDLLWAKLPASVLLETAVPVAQQGNLNRNIHPQKLGEIPSPRREVNAMSEPMGIGAAGVEHDIRPETTSDRIFEVVHRTPDTPAMNLFIRLLAHVFTKAMVSSLYLVRLNVQIIGSHHLSLDSALSPAR